MSEKPLRIECAFKVSAWTIPFLHVLAWIADRNLIPKIVLFHITKAVTPLGIKRVIRNIQ